MKTRVVLMTDGHRFTQAEEQAQAEFIERLHAAYNRRQEYIHAIMRWEDEGGMGG